MRIFDKQYQNLNKKFDGYFECPREEMIEFLPGNPQKILDVGCGAGEFGGLLKTQRDIEVWGIELNPEAAERAAQRLDQVLVGAFPDGVNLPEHYFDCIVFNDVLEHMIDPWSALVEAHKYLTISGHIVASIPNVRYLPAMYRLVVRGDWTYTSFGILDKTHLRFFTKKTMLEMLDQAGFEVLRITGIYPSPHWQVKVLKWILPRFVDETKYIDYAIVACPKVARNRGS